MKTEISITELYQSFEELYGPSSSFFANLTMQENKELIDLCCKFLEMNIHPISAFSKEGIVKLKELTNVDFNTFTVTDAQSLILDSILNTPKLTKDHMIFENQTQNDNVINDNFDPKNFVPQDAVCSFYSLGDNLSQTYEYANPTNIPNCSNKKVNQFDCFTSSNQSRCPLYQPDYSLLAVHSISEFGKEFTYSAYKYRNINSQLVILIYNDSNVLINNLSYPLSAISELAKGVLEEEVTSIIKEIHKKSFIETFSEMNVDYPLLESTVSVSNSYISTLLS
jgi:hypothetical protein